MPRKKVNFVKTKKVKKGDFKGLQKGLKTKKMSEKRALKKQEKGQGFIQGKIYGSNPVEMSPYKMGHESPAKMESAKQERKDLMKDMPVDKRASAMQMHCMGSPTKMGHESPMKMGGSWISKHSKSAFQMGHDSPAKMHHPMNEEEKKFRKNVAKKTTDAAIDFIAGPIGQIPGVKNKVQSLKNKKNRALGLGVKYKEAYVDADKKKYPTEASFTKAAKAYNNRNAAPQHKGSAYGAKHSEEVGHQGANIHSHTSGKQKKRDDQMAAAKKRKKVKATIKAGKAIAKSM